MMKRSSFFIPWYQGYSTVNYFTLRFSSHSSQEQSSGGHRNSTSKDDALSREGFRIALTFFIPHPHVPLITPFGARLALPGIANHLRPSQRVRREG